MLEVARLLHLEPVCSVSKAGVKLTSAALRFPGLPEMRRWNFRFYRPKRWLDRRNFLSRRGILVQYWSSTRSH